MAIGSLALMLFASLAVATPASAYQVRVRAQVQEQDSLVLLREELQRVAMTQEMLTRQLRLANNAVRRASSNSERDAFRARVSELMTQLQRTLNDGEALRTHLLAKCASLPGPDGWLGIAFRESGDVSTSASGTTFVMTKYPTLVSVEPGSPAQKAGLLAGDEIVALGGRDYASGIDVAPLLKPGTQLAVRFRRDGELRTVTVNVEPRPEGFISNCPWIEIAAAPMVAQPKLQMFRLPDGGFAYTLSDSTAVASGARAGSVERAGARVRGTPVLPPTPYAPFSLRASIAGPNAVVAGAVLLPLTEDLREGLGLDEGVLVVDVLRGTPAFDAGLRSGDIITHVNGQKLQSIAALIAALERRGREVELQVSRRNAKPRTVRLIDEK